MNANRADAREQLLDAAEEANADGVPSQAVVDALRQAAVVLEDVDWGQQRDVQCNDCGVWMPWGEEFPDPSGHVVDSDALCPFCYHGREGDR